ncbi:MAG: phosphatidate cytidylyltransferase [Thermoguttaceae bacterium]|nr:phosphatidate cytidylyltransferase [Thermoguttaceae bacterium]MBQ6620464.1 phosphatidate cytidylyltransferase [Thermoguttaceae bacterium]MBR2584261.1 phosphatidate cytidylyltransferase [Thermoguttaceae bacterium]MBR3220112.1 phosphatidate cytidylyltransferase [Thermoguttaceae bacterium]
MLKWRLIIGTAVVLLLIGFFWLDHYLETLSAVPGLVLLPLLIVCVCFLCHELLRMLNAAGIYPSRSSVYLGVLWCIVCCWLACHKTLPLVQSEGWNVASKACVLTLLAMAVGIIIAFTGEMARYKEPGGNVINLSGAIFAITYLGLLGCFIIMLRIAYGVGAVVSMIITTKMCDIGAYFIGRAFGRHKMAANLSPGKTVEGAVGGLLFAVLAAWLTIDVAIPSIQGLPILREPAQVIGAIAFGMAIGAFGAIGDLAESFIKRDVCQKDSGQSIPGFGGILDIFDSLLIAAPVAFAFWAFGLIG